MPGDRLNRKAVKLKLKMKLKADLPGTGTRRQAEQKGNKAETKDETESRPAWDGYQETG